MFFHSAEFRKNERFLLDRIKINYSQPVKYFRFHEIELTYEGPETPFSSWLTNRLGAHQIAFASQPLFQIFFEDSSFLSPSQIPKKFSWVRSRPLWGDVLEPLFRITDGFSVIEVNYEKKTLRGFLHSKTISDPSFCEGTFFPLPLLEVFRTLGWFHIHGALLSKEEDCVFLLGPGGAGKSTTAAALMTQDWKVESDDSLLIQIHSPSLCQAISFEPRLSLSPKLMEQTGLRCNVKFDSEKWSVFFPPLSSGEKTMVPKKIFWLEKNPKDQILPLSPSRLLDLLLTENPLWSVFPPLAPLHTKTLQTLIQQTKNFICSLRWETPIHLLSLGNRVSALMAERFLGKTKTKNKPNEIYFPSNRS